MRLFLLFVMVQPVYAGDTWTLSAAEWARPRHGEWLASHPSLRAAVAQMQQTPHSQLQIRYPGGDEGVLWAEELQAWLVALGVESARIETLPGASSDREIELEVVAMP